MPEMERHAGRRVAVLARVAEVRELDRRTPARRPVCVLAGLNCTGAVVGPRGPCDRGCALLWHERWLEIEPAPAS
jgi:hypothetical protein